jgi:hypothetical protein
LVGHGHQVGGEGGMVGLLEARVGEGPGGEFSRCRVGGCGWLMRVEWAAIVFGWSELVSGPRHERCASIAEKFDLPHLDGGNCLFLFLAVPTGSKARCSSNGSSKLLASIPSRTRGAAHLRRVDGRGRCQRGIRFATDSTASLVAMKAGREWRGLSSMSRGFSGDAWPMHESGARRRRADPDDLGGPLPCSCELEAV